MRELVLVLGLPTGLCLASSLAWLARGGGTVAFTDARLLSTLSIEALLTATLLPRLRRRGWSPATVAGSPDLCDVACGLALWVAIMVAVDGVYLLAYSASRPFAATLATPHFAGAVSAATLVGTAVLNPVLEAFLWLGYAVPALASRVGLRAACGVSIACRVAVHAYQGRLAVLTILPVAAVLTWYHARSGRLWPAVVAHVVADTVGLLALVRPGG